MILELWMALCAAAPVAPVEVPAAVLRPVERVDVPAREFGTIAEITVRPGDEVQAGQLLLQIDDAEARLELGRAQLKQQVAAEKATDDVDLRFAQKSREVEEAELRRVEKGEERLPGSISEAEMDQLKLNVERAALAVEQAALTMRLSKLEAEVLQQEVQIAEQHLERRRVASPISGIVMEVKRHTGEWVEPGETVVRVVGLDVLRAEGFVDVKLSQKLKVHAPARFTVSTADGRTREYPGEVALVGQEVDPVNGQILVWVELDNAAHELKSGMSGRLTITADQ